MRKTIAAGVLIALLALTASARVAEAGSGRGEILGSEAGGEVMGHGGGEIL